MGCYKRGVGTQHGLSVALGIYPLGLHQCVFDFGSGRRGLSRRESCYATWKLERLNLSLGR